MEGIGGNGGTGQRGRDGPIFSTADALTTTGSMVILSRGAGVGSDGTSTAGAHGVSVLGQGGNGGNGQNAYNPGNAGAGGNAAGSSAYWVIGGADAGNCNVTTQGDYSTAFRIVGRGGDGGKGGKADAGSLYNGKNGAAGGSGANMSLFYGNPTPTQVLGTSYGDQHGHPHPASSASGTPAPGP